MTDYAPFAKREAEIDAIAGKVDRLIPARCEYRAIEIADFLALDLPPREMLLDPWLPRQGLSMIYAPRGVGKTYLALSVAYALASGGSVLRWRAPRPAGVLYIDGEMPAVVMQERLAALVRSSDAVPRAPLQILSTDTQPDGVPMPDLTRPEDHAALDPLLGGVEVIIVDNISTLCRTGRENEAESWLPVQGWALRQRASGRSVVFIHHAGKGGAQRGTSRREDVLDTVIALRRPAEYVPQDGAVFVVEYEKCRGIHGNDVTPFEARLATLPDGRMAWTTRDVETANFDRVIELLRDGLSQSEIAEELGINKSNVSRHARKAKEQGLIP
jgi:putative DNA primase/helicase